MISNLLLKQLKRQLVDFRLPILLVCIFLLGAALRFYKIGERCFFCDEVATIGIISQSSVTNLWKNVTDNFPTDLPFFYVLLHFWKIFNESTFWLRTLSVLSGSLLILVAYKLAKYLFDRDTALLTAYLVSISPLLILYSQILRYYSLNSLLNLLSLYIFIKAVHSNRISGWFFYALVMAISIYISYGSFLFLFFEGIFIIAYKRKYPLSFKRWLFCCAVIFLAYLPLIPYLFRDFNLLLKGDGVIRMPLKSGWIGTLAYFFFSFSLGQTISPFNYPVVIVAGIETSRWAHNLAVKRHKVYNKPLSELNLQKKYDIVTLFGIIEHLEDPAKELNLIYNILKPGGLIVIYTGDVDAWLPWLLGKKWWWFQGMHTFYFSRKTLQSLLERHNFKVVATKNNTVFFQLFSLGVSLQRYQIGRVIKPIFNIPLIRNLIIPLEISGEMVMFALKA